MLSPASMCACSVLLLAIMMAGCASGPSVQNTQNGPTAYPQLGQTIKELIDSLPSSGGTVILGAGSWSSGYDANTFISKPNITIQGAGMPGFNSDFTAMTGGTIVLGPLYASTGADFLTVKDLGVDVGSLYVEEKNEGLPADGLAIYNRGQVVGAKPVESPIIENVSCLGSSPSAAVHCMLIENVNHAYIHNVQAILNCHGVVLKGTNSTVDGVITSGHATDAVTVKSDVYAPASEDYLSNINIQPLFSPGDTEGINVIGVGAPLSGIHFSNVQVSNPLGWGIYIKGRSQSNSATNISISGLSVDDSGGRTAEYCIALARYVSAVHVQDLKCSNMSMGIAPYLPDQTFFGNILIIHSQFSNIATNAVQTYGSWTVFCSSFADVGGSGIVDPFGVTTVAGNTFTVVGTSNMLSTGGSFVSLPTSPCTSPVVTSH